MGRFHAHTIASLPNAQLTAIVDENEEVAVEVAKETGCETVARDPSPHFASPDIDAVLIATPAGSHGRLIASAALAGKAIFCEKPLAINMEESLRVVAVVEAQGVPFQIGFQRRFDAGVRRLAEIVSRAGLGTLETFRSVTADPAGATFEALQLASGIFHDTLSHDIDMALHFFGPIREVRAWGDACLDPRLLEIGKPDTTLIQLRFESGRMGTIENRLRTGYGYETLLEIGGSRGKGVVRDDHADPLTLYRDGEVVREHVDWFLERYRDAYRAELRAFVDAVLEDAEPEPGVRQGLEVQRACLAAERSYREDRTVLVSELR